MEDKITENAIEKFASEQIELLQLDKSGIKVAEYTNELPKHKLLEKNFIK